MKPKQKKDLPAEFQNRSSNDDFKKLMKQMGVRKLDSRPNQKPPPKPETKPDPVEFLDDESILQSALTAKKNKYSKTIQQIGNAFSRKRKKIAPGFSPDAELDLHGYTREEAIPKIEYLLEQSRKQNYKTVLIITGRGLNSGQKGGVLRQAVWKWLNKNQRLLHITCKWAPVFLGGKGAIIVFFN